MSGNHFKWDREAAIRMIAEERVKILHLKYQGLPFDNERLESLTRDLVALTPSVTHPMAEQLERATSMLERLKDNQTLKCRLDASVHAVSDTDRDTPSSTKGTEA